MTEAKTSDLVLSVEETVKPIVNLGDKRSFKGDKVSTFHKN